MTQEELDALVKVMDGKPGDLLLFAADKNKVVWDSLGALRLELAQASISVKNTKWRCFPLPKVKTNR